MEEKEFLEKLAEKGRREQTAFYKGCLRGLSIVGLFTGCECWAEENEKDAFNFGKGIGVLSIIISALFWLWAIAGI